jgi:transmembrane 9 superfamily protein 2/4
MAHEIPQSGLTPASEVATCNAEGSKPVVNDPAACLALKSKTGSDELPVICSHEIEWIESELPWADRWDVCLIGSPDDDIHSFAIINSLMIVLFLTGAIATIMIRTLRRDVAGHNEMQTLEEAQEETGWKLVHGDVFRPPATQPMLFSVLVGTGAQIGSAFFSKHVLPDHQKPFSNCNATRQPMFAPSLLLSLQEAWAVSTTMTQ